MFDAIIGNNDIKKILEFKIAAAKKRETALSHILFEAAPGYGKTSMAKAIAEAVGSSFVQVSPRTLQTPRDLFRVVGKLSASRFPVLFIDETHALRVGIQEAIGIMMEDFQLSCLIDDQVLTEQLPPFTLIGATTIAGTLSKPFRERFKLVLRLQSYSLSEAIQIVLHHAAKRGIQIEPEAAEEIATRSKNVPRLIVNLLENICDYWTANFGPSQPITRQLLLLR